MLSYLCGGMPRRGTPARAEDRIDDVTPVRNTVRGFCKYARGCSHGTHGSHGTHALHIGMPSDELGYQRASLPQSHAACHCGLYRQSGWLRARGRVRMRARMRVQWRMHELTKARARMQVCMHACMGACVRPCSHAHTGASMHACMHVCMHACAYARVLAQYEYMR